MGGVQMMVRIRLAPGIIRRARPALFCCAGTMAAGLLVSPPSLSQSQPLASSHAFTQVPRLLVAPDPDRLEVRTLLDVLRAAARALYIGALLVPSLLVLLPAYLFPSHCQAILETEMLRALERGGPCLIKLGQWASTRADILPPSLCRRLSSLHDGAPAHAFHHTEQAIESAFSAPLGRNFARLDVQPVGSGCIAQVHLGETVEGTRVAVKVLHPNVERLVATDVYLLRTAARLVEQLVPLPGIRWLALSESVDHFATFMSSQLDLRHEAANLDRFRLNFARQASDGDGAIEFPRPLHEERLVSSRVLVETFVQGESVSSLLHRAAERAPGGTAMEGLLGLGKARDAEFTRAGLIAFFKMMFRDNFVHGDLHPGGDRTLSKPRGQSRIRTASPITMAWPPPDDTWTAHTCIRACACTCAPQAHDPPIQET